MSTSRPALAKACALALLLLPISATNAIGHESVLAHRADPASSAVAVRPPTADEPAPVIHRAYEVLMDRFVDPPRSANLLWAAVDGALGRVAKAKPGEWPRAQLAFDGSRDGDWVRFERWFDTLAGLAAPDLDRTVLERAAVTAMARSLDEGHTRYLTPTQYQDYLAWGRGEAKYIGVGLRLRGSIPTVVEVYDGSPAEAAGLRAGDVVVAVDGAPAEGSSEATISRLRGSRGTSVELLLRRHDVDQPFRVGLIRDEIAISFVGWRVLDGRIGYIRLRGFPEPSVDEQFSRALDELDAAGIGGLIVDLRGNAGGRLDIGVRMTSHLVRDGVLYQQVDRAGQRRLMGPTGDYWQHAVPIVALIDEGTASMGELFASALKETGTARLLGTRTSGNVAGAQTVALPDGSAIRVTILQITSGLGVTLNRVGVPPDQAVEISDEDLRRGRDAQLEAALSHLRTVAQPPAEETLTAVTWWSALAPAA